MTRSNKAFLARAVVLASLSLSTSAFAGPAGPTDKARAKEAYDRGLEAHKRGDTHAAAEEFARADSLAPSGVALRAAIDAAIESDDPALGSELVERSKREPASGTLATSIATATTKFKGRAGRLRVVCPRGSTCLAKVDETPIETDKVVWARTGQRTIIVQVDGDAQTKLVDLGPDQVVDVTSSGKNGAVVESSLSTTPASSGSSSSSSSSASSSPEAEKPRQHPKDGLFGDGLPPIYFYAGVGVTAIFAGMTTIFAIDSANEHSSFKDAGCEQTNYPACATLASDGEGAQTRTNVSLVLTALSGIATTVIGVRLTNWEAPTFAFHPGGGTVGWRATF